MLGDMGCKTDRWMKENITDMNEEYMGEGNGRVVVDEAECDIGVFLNDMERKSERGMGEKDMDV